jgi:hypothetical protein
MALMLRRTTSGASGSAILPSGRPLVRKTLHFHLGTLSQTDLANQISTKIIHLRRGCIAGSADRIAYDNYKDANAIGFQHFASWCHSAYHQR